MKLRSGKIIRRKIIEKDNNLIREMKSKIIKTLNDLSLC